MLRCALLAVLLSVDCGAPLPVPVDPREARVDVTLRNATTRQATFHVGGGGVRATRLLYQTRWLPAGGEATLPDAMRGPVGVTLPLVATVTVEWLGRCVHSSAVELRAERHLCTLTLLEEGGAPRLLQECL